MPSSVNLPTGTTLRPGVYATVDASSLGGRNLEIGVVGIVGDLPFLKAATPVSVASPSQLLDLDPSNENAKLLSKILYDASSDGRIPGAPTRVVLCGVQTTTSAIKALGSTSPNNDQIVLEAKAFGHTGNRTFVTIENGSTGSDFRKFTISRDGVTEEFDDLGTGDLFTVLYSGTEAATMTAEMSDTVKIGSETASGAFKINYTVTGKTSNYTPVDMVFDGPVSMQNESTLSGTANVKVIGIDKATGAAVEEATNFSGGSTTKTTSTVFSSVSEIQITGNGGVAFTFSGTAIDISTTAFTKAQDIVDRINTFSGQKFTATTTSPQTSTILSSDMDFVAAASIRGASVGFTADCSAIVDGLKGSKLVTPNLADQYERTSYTNPAAGNRFIPDTQAQTPLVGGTVTAATGTEWTAALTALQTEDLQTLVPLSNNDAYHRLVRAHCQFMAGQANVPNERNAIVGAASFETKSQVTARAKGLNTRHLSLVFQEIEIFGPSGAVERLEPYWLAVHVAAMQAGSEVGTPLTRKRPNVLDVFQAPSILPDSDTNSLLQNGLLFLTKDRLGLRIERSVTTYLTDDNPIFSELSAVESVNTSIRDLRLNLDTIIGDPTRATTAKVIASIAKSRLRNQVGAGIIKAFNEQSVTVTDLGDTFRINYEMAATEPLNFIIVAASVTRIPTSA